MDEAFDAWDELWQDTGSIDYSVTGVLALSREEHDDAEVLREGLDRLRKPYALLSPD